LNIASANDPENIIRVVRVYLFLQHAEGFQVSAGDGRSSSDLGTVAPEFESTTECNYSGNRRASRDCTFCPFIIKNPRALREWQYLRRPAFFYPRAMVRLIFHLLGNPSDYITPRKRKSWRKASPLSIRRAPRGLSCVLS